MSKLSSDLVEKAVSKLLAYSQGLEVDVPGKGTVKGKKRNFVETIELQMGLKNYDPSKDKRFNGSIRLPAVPRPNLRVCVLGNEKHCQEARELGVASRNADELKSLNKDKKLIKKLALTFDVFLASSTLIKQIPRLLGPGLNRAGKFPILIGANESLKDKVEEVKATVKFQMKKAMCLNVAVGNVSMEKGAIVKNASLACNFLASLLKKNWQNIGGIYIKSTMGPSQQIFF